jgi:N-acyl-D-amino-acid deacylase
MYATHMRSEGGRLLESIADVLNLARATGIQVQISHLKTSGRSNWSKVDAALELIRSARAAGVNVQSDRYPYTAAGTDLDVVLPDWASAGGRDAILASVRGAETHRRLVEELNASGRDWSAVMIGGGWSDTVRAFSGRTLAEAAKTLGFTPGETVCRFIDADESRTGAFFFGMCEANLHRIYAEPWIMPGSDASVRAPWGPLGADYPHPRAYGTMPRFLRLLTGRVEGFAKICGLEEAIRRMTSLPAQTFGLRDRGVLKAGAFADLAVVDEATFADAASYEKPHQFATGVKLVAVNGAVSYEDGRFTGERRGRFLERAAR